jgi:dTDP-4-dehydrorhamnose reductase
VNVLVIGREGQLARSLAAAKKPEGVQVTVVGRPEINLAATETIPPVLERFRPDLIVNTAAYTAVDQAELEPQLAHAINARAPGFVADACARRGIPLIHISTDYVFDGSKQGPYLEDDQVAPLSVYGRSKLEGEEHVASAWSRHIILRTAWVVSPYGSNFVRTMLRLAAGRKEIDVVDDQVGNPTYAPHLAAGILAIARRCGVRGTSRVPWGLYHAAGSGEATWCELARELFHQSAAVGGPGAAVRAITTAEYPTLVRRPTNSRLDCSKLARAFDVRLPDWRLGIRECVQLMSGAADILVKGNSRT